jgi:release factor glutamine methyltransferase
VNRREALARARDILAKRGIEDASLEGEILLRHVLEINRAQLYADLDNDLSREHERRLNRWLERRRLGEPSAYITGHREFYGLDFRVDRSVLIPRPESELLVELAIKLASCKTIKNIADIGTGCGAITVSLAVHLPEATLYATDISPEALEVARSNCQRHGVAERVVLRHGNLLEPLEEPVDMIVANLPYVRERDLTKNSSLGFEPALALNGGKNGLDTIKSLCLQAGKKLKGGGYLLLEIGEGQAPAVTAFLRKTFPEAAVEVHKDLAGIARAVSVCLKQEIMAT